MRTPSAAVGDGGSGAVVTPSSYPARPSLARRVAVPTGAVGSRDLEVEINFPHDRRGGLRSWVCTSLVGNRESP